MIYFIGSGGINLVSCTPSNAIQREIDLVLCLTTTKAPREGLLCWYRYGLHFFIQRVLFPLVHSKKDFRCKMTILFFVQFVIQKQSFTLSPKHRWCLCPQVLAYYRGALQHRTMHIFSSVQILVAVDCSMIHSETIWLLNNYRRSTNVGTYKKPEMRSLVFHLSGFWALFHIFSRYIRHLFYQATYLGSCFSEEIVVLSWVHRALPTRYEISLFELAETHWERCGIDVEYFLQLDKSLLSTGQCIENDQHVSFAQKYKKACRGTRWFIYGLHRHILSYSNRFTN